MSAKVTKAQLIALVLDNEELENGVERDARERQLKKLTVKKLSALASGEPDEETTLDEEGTIPEEAVSTAKADRLVKEGAEKFEYVQDKDPSPKHEFYAAMISALTGVEVTPKQYQAMIVTHRYIQASDLNRVRKDYRPRTAASVLQAAATLQERADQLLVDDEGAVITKNLNHISADLAERINSMLAQEEAEQAEEAETVEA